MSLVTLARKHRKDLTDAEALLWNHLRRRRLGNAKFRRQHPLGPFISDFISFESRIAIELDGEQHLKTTVQDHKRDKWFEKQGFTVLRFWNNELFRDIEAVLKIIAEELRKRESVRGQ